MRPASSAARSLNVVSSHRSALLNATMREWRRCLDVRENLVDRVGSENGSGCEVHDHCRITSASATSSSVDLNASTNCVGNLRTNRPCPYTRKDARHRPWCVALRCQAWRTTRSPPARPIPSSGSSTTTCQHSCSRPRRWWADRICGAIRALTSRPGPSARSASSTVRCAYESRDGPFRSAVSPGPRDPMPPFLPGRLTARLTGQGIAPAAQTREACIRAEPAPPGPCPHAMWHAGRNVEDHGGTVHHLHLGGVFQASTLAWRQVVVDHDGVGLLARHDVGDLLRLAGPDICGGVGLERCCSRPSHTSAPAVCANAANSSQRLRPWPAWSRRSTTRPPAPRAPGAPCGIRLR